MSEYDIALDSQMQWALFWTSDAGRELFHRLGVSVSESREKKGEKEFRAILDQETDELQLVLLPIIKGECYYWKPELLDLMKSVSSSLPDNWLLTRSHIPATAGFFYFAKDIDGLQAMAWSTLSLDREDPESRVAALHIPNDDGLPNFDVVALILFMRNPSFPTPIPARVTLHVGEALRDWKLAAVREADRIAADIKDFASSFEDIRLFGAMLSFIQQRILIPYNEIASRATRHRVGAYRQSQLSVNVIRLRSISHRSKSGNGESINWTCQWMVRGHWRQQWYPSLAKHQPIFIKPFIKGPENKPLKEAQRLFAVVR